MHPQLDISDAGSPSSLETNKCLSNYTSGFSKKLGLPDYGSVGASCGVMIELDSSLLQSDLEAFQKHARQALNLMVRGCVHHASVDVTDAS